MEDIGLYPGIWFRNVQGKYCQLITVALNEETGDKMAVYQKLYGDFKTCVMKRDDFLKQMKPVLQSKVTKPRAERNKGGQDAAERERIKIEETKLGEIRKAMAKIEAEKEQKEKAKETDNSNAASNAPAVNPKETEEEEATRMLMEFLEAETYKDKRNIFANMRNKDNKRVLRNIAASLDLAVDCNTPEEYCDAIMSCLSARVRFEINR